MDKKSYRRSLSSSSTSSTTSSSSSTVSSSSTSDSSEDSRYLSPRKSHGSSYKRQSRSIKKSRSHKRNASGSDRAKPKKSKSLVPGHHGSSKTSARKSGHSSHKDYDMSYRSRSPTSHQRRSGGSKKLLSPQHKRGSSPSSSRKSRKMSPLSYRKGSKRSVSPRDRLELQGNLSPPGRLRDPRLERALKRSPEVPSRYRESPKRYEKDDYFDRSDRRQEMSVRSREDRSPREYSRQKRDHYDEFRRDDRDKGIRAYKDRLGGDRDGYGRESDYTQHPSREFYGRDSRESSLERMPYGDMYDTYDRDTVRIEGRSRYDDLQDRKMSDFSRRGMPNPIDARYADDRRKGGHHDPWLDHRPSTSGSSHHMEGDNHSYPRRGHHEWDKSYHKKRRDWQEDFPRSDWSNKPNESARGWSHSRRHAHWDENEGNEWGSAGSKRGGRSPNVPVKAPPTPKSETKSFVPEIVEKTPPRSEPETKEKDFTPLSPTVSGTNTPVVPSTPPEPVVENVPSKEPSLVEEKDNFSDVSDDSDDILNQEPVDVPEEKTDNVSSKDPKSPEKETVPFDGEFENEDSRMDLEEISDDDLEEEKQVKYSVADALDIDWSTLKVEPHTEKPTRKTSKRFSATNLFSLLGISSKYARPEIIKRIRNRCALSEQDKQKAEAELEQSRDEETELPTVKKEDIEEESTVDILPVVFSGGVVRTVKYDENKRGRVFRLGPHRKALSLADDVAIRRRICRQPEDETFYENFNFDPQLFNQAAQLMKTCS